jgi:hypothetical protein
MTLAVSIAQMGSNNTTFRNRLINGAMVIDQRNAGASVTPTDGQFSVDRWKASLTQASKFSLQQNAAAVTPPSGYTNYLGATSLSAFSVGSGDVFGFQQCAEGLNISDLAWGTASAATVTISFWVRSSLTGTFAGSVRNNAGNRSYVFTYTISAANTWEQKSVTIAGDTSGTWLATSGIGIALYFCLGAGSTYSTTASSWAAGNFVNATGATSVVGTNGATFYITGVQLEAGSTASPFEYRSYGTELALCQRYYELLYAVLSSSVLYFPWAFKVTKRTTPTFVLVQGSANGGSLNPGTIHGTYTEVLASSATAVTFSASAEL